MYFLSLRDVSESPDVKNMSSYTFAGPVRVCEGKELMDGSETAKVKVECE